MKKINTLSYLTTIISSGVCKIVKSNRSRGAGFGAALVLTHLQHYHDPSDNTKSIFQTFTFYTDGVAYFPYYVRPLMNFDENWQFYERKLGLCWEI